MCEIDWFLVAGASGSLLSALIWAGGYIFRRGIAYGATEASKYIKEKYL